MVFSHGEEPLNAPDKQFITQLTDWQKRLFDYLVTILVNVHDMRLNLTFGTSTSLQIDRQTGIELGCIGSGSRGLLAPIWTNSCSCSR